MKKLKKFLFAAFTVAILSCLFCQPAFAAISESDVQAQVDAVGKEAVSGNVFIWFLCAIGFLKVGQKIDSFLSSLGVNVGHTGGSMLAEAMIAARGIGGIKNFSSHHFGGGRNSSSTNVNANGGKGSGGFGAGFASGGLAGVVSRKVTNSAIKTATTTPGSKPSGLGSLLGDAAAGGIGGHMYASSVSKGGNFANNVIGSVATGSISQMGSISGEKAAEALHSYMGYAALESGAEIVPTFQNVEIGGGRITGTEVTAEHPEGMEIRRVDRSVNEILDGPGIQLSELAAKIQQLHIFFSLLIPDMSHEERQLLDEALVRTYNTKGITHDNASLEDPAQPGQYREMPVLGDLYEILKTSKETMRMAHILNRLVNGSASTFNKQTNVRLDNKYTVLDISSLTGDLLTVGMFVALDFVWDRAKADRTEEKAIFIDECWQLLSGAGAAGVRLAGDFLLEIAKTIRGYGGASIFASQDLADFFDLDGGRFGKGIINNSKTKIILNLEDDEAQRVQEALHLSDAETMEITHFERGHGLISTNNNNIMVEFKASPLEKDLITTDRRELREIVERKRREQSTSAEQQI